MRPRISNKSASIIKYKEMNEYLTRNSCYGTTARFNKDKTIDYTYLMMYRSNRKDPVEAIVTVSIVSKNVLYCSIGGQRIESVDKFMDLCKFNRN